MIEVVDKRECSCSGIIDTEALRHYDSTEVNAAIAALPIPRMRRSSEVALTVAFLASDATAYITGETLFVDGEKHFARAVTN